MTIKDLIEKFGDTNENWLILEFLLDRKISELKFFSSDNVDKIYEKFLEIKNKRAENYPLQYIFGKWEFYGLELFVDESALIPRFETEILVDKILNLNCEKSKILDIGTGTGAIALSLSHNLENSSVIGIDISERALALANKNKEKLKLKNVKFLHSDIFSNVKVNDFNIIVSNPPYIGKEEMVALEKELSFEPQNALYGGEDGLYFYRNIVKNANNYLVDNGIIAFEIGYNQREIICDMLIKENFEILICEKDFAGFDRIIIARKGR